MTNKKLLPLFVSARRSSWRMIDWHADEGDRRYASIRKQVLERDGFACGYCGFRSKKYQHVHHLNHDHGSLRLDNLVTACPLCHQCFHLGLAGVKSSGLMIYATEFSQAEINNMARACFIAVYRGGSNAESAQDLYEALRERRILVEDLFGPGSTNPSFFGQAFVEMRPEIYAERKSKLPGLRLLPKMEAFGKEIVFWDSDSDTYGLHPDTEWNKFSQKAEVSIDFAVQQTANSSLVDESDDFERLEQEDKPF